MKRLMIVMGFILTSCIEEPKNKCEDLEKEYRELQFNYMVRNSNKDYEILRFFLEVNQDQLIQCGLIKDD